MMKNQEMAEGRGFEPRHLLTQAPSFQDCCRYPESFGLPFQYFMQVAFLRQLALLLPAVLLTFFQCVLD